MTPLVRDRLVLLDKLTLDCSNHASFEQGHCATELVSWLADEPFSDHPACLSPVLGAFLRDWNDGLDDEGRQKLKPFLPRTIGTAGDGHDEERAWLVTDWLVRVWAPAWLELAGVKESPAALRALSPLVDVEAARSAQATINKAQSAGAAAWAAAGAAAWAAAGAAAWAATGAATGAAAWAAARAAAGAAAWAATGAATGAAAWAATGAATGAAARAATGAATGAAARAAARAATGAATGAAARAAARAALEPTKVELQSSALGLLESMVRLGESERKAA
jgi:hypothetical protein